MEQKEKQWRVYTWEEFASDVEKIAKTIKSWGKEFKYVYGPPRGGLTLAVCLSHRLDLKLVFYNDPDPKNDFLAKEVLIVDDIADTGKTLKDYKDGGYFIATLFKHRRSVFEPDIWTKEKGDDWVLFPWETRESTK